jgi:histidine ammonia-lyase
MGEQLMTIMLNGSDLTVTQVVAAARHGEAVVLAPEAIVTMRESRAVVEEVLNGGEPVYGLTTGVGERKSFLLDPAERQRFNHRLVLNHRIAQGAAAPADAHALMSVFDVAGALDLEAFGANLTCLHPIIEQTRPFPGLGATLGRLRTLLAGSYLWRPGAARFLQDPLTFRCIPHIHGAARDALAYTRTILQLELNSSQSNPVVVVAERRIVSVGNFDIGPLAAGLAAIAGSPDDALSELAVAGQAITVEARTLAHPVSYELASSVKGEGIEDRATMAPLSVRRLAGMVQLCARVAAIEAWPTWNLSSSWSLAAT